MVIPQQLTEIRDFLASNGVQLSKQFQDGRINASINEDEVIKAIQSKFHIDLPPPRHWYDFAIPKGNEQIPVNIKITSTSTADNVQCKLGMYYALTGIWPTFANETPWRDYFALLKRGLSTSTDKDYYFLVVSKTNLRDIFCTSLKQIQTLVANGNNLPFQCNWGNNRNLKSRTHDGAIKFLLGKFRESIQLRANILDEFEEHLGDVI
ncbi:MAG: restriction endonuclease [Accumulibacter sp.]|jgi:hypothetical protein|uniref:restriction endonuclease n=1 Tax=Accumulibacter sp. TaxID=2053492 RepID=UPI002FC2AD7F